MVLAMADGSAWPGVGIMFLASFMKSENESRSSSSMVKTSSTVFLTVAFAFSIVFLPRPHNG